MNTAIETTEKAPRKNAAKGTSENQAIAAALGETKVRKVKEIGESTHRLIGSAFKLWEKSRGLR